MKESRSAIHAFVDRSMHICIVLTLFFAVDAFAHSGEHPTMNMATQLDRYQLSQQVYHIPDAVLLNSNGHPISLQKELNTDSLVILNFIFTSCTTICPITSATFSQVQRKLNQTATDFKMISISIDPEHDTPAVLKRYSHRYNPGSHWRFLTGDLDAITHVQRAFDAYRGNKMNHVPLTFIRPTVGDEWYRIEGFTSASRLVAELERLSDHDRK